MERHREAIATGFPRFWRQSGGYRLDRLAGLDRLVGSGGPDGLAELDRAAGLDLAKFVVGLRGHPGHSGGGDGPAGPAPRHRVIAVGHFTSVQAAIEATEDALVCQPAAVELLDRTIIELSRQKIEYRSLGTILRGDPEALLFVTFFGDTRAEAVAGLDRLEEGWRAHGHGYRALRAVDATEQAALLKVGRGRPGPAHGGEHRYPQAAGLRRGHRRQTRPSWRRTPAASGRSSTRRPDGRLLRSLFGRVPAYPPVRRSQRSPDSPN